MNHQRIIKPNNSITGVAAAVPCFLLGAELMLVWIDPLQWDGISWMRYAIGLLMIELFMAFGGIFVAGAIPNKHMVNPNHYDPKYVVIICSIFVLCSTLSISKNIYFLFVYFLVSSGRLLIYYSVKTAMEAALFQMRIFISTLVFFLLFVISIFLPIPKLGITREVLRLADLDTNSIYDSDPEIAIAVLIFYYLFLGLMELFLFSSGLAKKTKWARKQEMILKKRNWA